MTLKPFLKNIKIKKKSLFFFFGSPCRFELQTFYPKDGCHIHLTKKICSEQKDLCVWLLLVNKKKWLIHRMFWKILERKMLAFKKTESHELEV